MNNEVYEKICITCCVNYLYSVGYKNYYFFCKKLKKISVTIKYIQFDSYIGF